MTHSPRSIDVPGASHKAPIPAAARVGPMLCTSAISGKDPATGELPPDVEKQAHNAFLNLRNVLAVGGASLAQVVKFDVTLNHEAVRPALNSEWLAAFPDPADRPARHITVHDLQHGMHLQIEVIAFIQ